MRERSDCPDLEVERFAALRQHESMRHVFLSYVREDSEKVDQLRKALVARGIDVWMDQQSIGVGQQWGLSISEAIKSAAFFIACFSGTSVRKSQSGMDKELTLAAEQLALRSPESFWLIPVKLSPCELPDNIGLGGFAIRSIQHVSLFADWNAGIQNIADFILLKTEQRVEILYRDELTKVLRSHSSLSGLHVSPMLPKQLISEALEGLGDARVPRQMISPESYTDSCRLFPLLARQKSCSLLPESEI